MVDLTQLDTLVIRTIMMVVKHWTLWLSAPDFPSSEAEIIRQLDTPAISTRSSKQLDTPAICT
jgi:hypothetical protein